MEFKDLAAIPTENKFDNFLERYRQNKSIIVVIFGCGDQGMLTAALLQENGISVQYFCDNNKSLHGQLVKGIEVIAPDSLTGLGGEYIVINNDSYRDAKNTQLVELGVAVENIYTFDVFNPLFKGLTRQYVEEHLAEFENAYNLLDDLSSKKTFIKYLQGVYTGDLDYYAEIACGDDYFPKDIAPKKSDHIFLDVGAYNGNTIEAFIEFAGDYEKIYAFEPFTESAQMVKDKAFSNTEVHVAAASDYTGKKDFYCNNYGNLTMVTTILEEGAKHEKITLNTVAIDDVLNGRKATFIKMDIEGSELDALHGAEKTIQKYKPFLAICVYHKKEDLITILPYLKSIVPEYKMYLKHHSKTASDLVLYCIANS